ncbi:unnamed protein product [Caenorhabditis brenneri]
MSLSRLVNFPLLKLPWLCIECVIKNWDIVDIIFFALFSKRVRRIVKHLKIPLNRIEIFVRECKWIELERKEWKVTRTNSQSLFEEHPDLRKDCLVLQNNEYSLYTSKTDCGFESYTHGNEMAALKMVMEFLNVTFKCTIERVWIEDGNFPESGDIGVKSTVNILIDYMFGYAQNRELNLLLENLEVTDTCTFWMRDIDKDFYCDPKLFKCKELVFWPGSSTWITPDLLMQFEVPRLTFLGCPFSVEDILSFITKWFHSDNRQLEYLSIEFRPREFSLDDFQTVELDLLPFSERARVPLSESLYHIDFSKGLEIVRNDGLEATVHVGIATVTPQLTIEQQFNSTYATVSQQVQATDKFAAVTHQSQSFWAYSCYAAVTQHLYYSYTAFAGAL